MAFATSVRCAAPQSSTKEDPKSRSMLGLWTRTTWSAQLTRPGSAEESGGYPPFQSIIDTNMIASEAEAAPMEAGLSFDLLGVRRATSGEEQRPIPCWVGVRRSGDEREGDATRSGQEARAGL